MFIANIVIEDKTHIEAPDYINIVEHVFELKLGIPTLFIGWNFVNKFYKNLNILNRVISEEENIYWTFSKFEKRDINEKETIMFYDKSIDFLENSIKYHYYSVITESLKRTKCLIRFINNKKHKIIYIHNNRMVYIYINNSIIGFSLDECEFIGIKKEKIVNFLYKNNEFNHKCELTEIMVKNKYLIKKIADKVKLLPIIYCKG